jgi:hypothetical protein
LPDYAIGALQSLSLVFADVVENLLVHSVSNRKFAGTTTAGFFDAPDAAIAGQVMVFGMDWFRQMGCCV